ncbi:8561_t:CDS:2, partial [Cetraspora pellucida]
QHKKNEEGHHKGKGMSIVLQVTMPEGTNTQVDAFQANSDTNMTDSMSQDWLEIMEDIEGSGNLCDDRAGAKLHFVKGTRMYLEIIFTDEQKMREYTKKGIDMFQQTFYDHISSRTNQDLLSVRLRRVPIMDKDTISEEIKWAFDEVGTIMAIKPLLYEGTPIQSDQWGIIFDITEDAKLAERMPRYVNIIDQKFKKHKNKQSERDVEPEPVRETVEEKTEIPYINRSQNSELCKATEIEQDIYMAMVDAPLETAPTQLNMHNEEIVLPNNLELTSTTPIVANKENIAPAGPIRNEEEKDKINNNMLHEQSLLLNNGTTNIIQPEVDDGFTKVTYNKKKKKKDKKDRREILALYKKPKTSQ